ncbi:MAG: bifunctional 5,10-methylene-tetrahydrofolate dehydrogenase/5,10-methylene-tetrahydrofolate cyclohydrolase [Chloroflexi bacterium]|nr:bifunctional 5,10-methylene-tetrahydrofolate dehydrogenase/5,10-methylene-tetrahydrofolate cyclohydrolase [Chloroflexota bacterium]
MPGVILDGRQISRDIRQELRERVMVLAGSAVVPKLAGIIVGDDAGSASYVRLKEKAAAEVGLLSEMCHLPQDYTQKDLLARIRELNRRPDVHGIFVQLPLPPQFSESVVLAAVSPAKDVDGFHPESVGRSWLGQEAFVPATPAGIMEMLRRSGYGDLRHRHAVIVNVDNLVGKPLAALLCQESVGADVTLCHPDTPVLADWTRQADLLVVAANRPRFITADMVKEGVIAVDFGTNHVKDTSAKQGYRLVGDIDFEPVREKAKAITPVPGGVGPMTVTMLLAHIVEAAERLAAIS